MNTPLLLASGYFYIVKWLLFIFLFAPLTVVANQPSQTVSTAEAQWIVKQEKKLEKKKSKKRIERAKKRGRIRRGVAMLLTILLGPFGVHRLYLGTAEKIPLFYTLTLGGLMILPIIDMFCILFTKDIGKYINNESFLMW